MPVPSTMADLNVSEASNSPAGTDPIGSSLDNYLRATQAIVRREQAQGAAIASSATTNIGANTDGSYVHITGSTTITSFGTIAAGISRTLVFDSVLTLTHNATSLVLPGGSNITTAPGDVAQFVSEGSGVWRCVRYSTISGAPVASSSTPKNRLINGAMAIDQRNAGTSQTFTAGAALAYCIDRWYGYCTGANVTGQRVTHTQDIYVYQFSGAAGVSSIGFAQRIEAANCADLAGKTATLSVDLANSLLTSVTWTAYYAATTDSFGTLASPTRTQIATGTFTASSTLTRQSVAIAIPSAATTGIEIVLSVGSQTSGTWTIGLPQLEAGGYASSFERMPIEADLRSCKRYFERFLYSGGGNAYAAGITFAQWIAFKVVKRVPPTIVTTSSLLVKVSSLTGDSITIDGYRSLAVISDIGPWSQQSSDTSASAEL